MSHADFARVVGSPNAKAPIRWEDKTVPKRFASAISQLTPYEPAVFGAPGEAALLRRTFAHDLEAIAGEKASAKDVQATFRVFAAAIDFLAKGDTRAALRLLSEGGYL